MNGKTLKRYSIRIGIGAMVLGALALWLSPSVLFAKTPSNLDWPNHGNDLHNTRFQDVDQINPKNAHKLRPAWVFHTRTLDRKTGKLDPLAELQVSPIVVNGRMFVTDGHSSVFALDAATGKQIWEYKPTKTDDMAPIEDMIVCCGRNNKGVAVANGKVIYGRLDNVVVALDAASGHIHWKTRLAQNGTGYAINNAPQIADGIAVISLSGGEFEVRGMVFGLDVATGNKVWERRTTVPASYGDTPPTRAQSEKGGAAVWNPVAIDTDLKIAYMPTGNAAPDILGEDRPGHNDFATSVLALNSLTGVPVWSFQEVHHDIWDYDSAQPAVLFSFTKDDGKTVPALGHCSKNGQYYILDRRDGTPLFPVVEMPVPTNPAFQNAALTQPFSAVEHLTPLTFVRPNDTGFPPAAQYTPPGETEFVMVPGDDGGCEWGPAAFSPRTRFVYYGTRYEPTTFKTKSGNKDTIHTATGDLHLGSRFTNSVPGSHPFGLFGATDTRSGKIVWTFPRVDKNFRLQKGQKDILPAKSGLAIGGDVLFFSEGNGKFHAANANDGSILFTFDAIKKIPNAGGGASSPVVYVVNGREFVVYAFGGNVPDRNNFASFVDANSGKVGDAIVAFALPGKEEEDDDDD
jgi:alcohol dehydrogenase (cytochrome c)